MRLANRPEDLWSQVDWLKPGYLGSYWSFQDQYMVFETRMIRRGFYGSPTEQSFREVTGYKNLDHLKARVEPFSLRRLKSEVAPDLPPKSYETREVILTPEQRQLYDRIRQETTVWLQTLDEGTLRLRAREVVVKMLRLSQIVDGFLTDVSWEKPQWIDSPQIEELDDLIEETVAAGQKLVVWSRFATLVHRLVERYQEKYGQKAVIELSGRIPEKMRSMWISAFQGQACPHCYMDKQIRNPSGFCDHLHYPEACEVCKPLAGMPAICIAQIQTGGIGIDLSAASVEVFMEKALISLHDITQAEDRLHRLTTHPVTIVSLLARGMIDDHWELVRTRELVRSESI